MTDAEVCRLHGWGPGTILSGMVEEDLDLPDEVSDVLEPLVGLLVMRITAIGEESVMGRPLTINGDTVDDGECLLQIDGTDWEEVLPSSLRFLN